MDLKIQWAISKMLDAITPNFHGSITFSFAGGKIQYVRCEETLKPPEESNG